MTTLPTPEPHQDPTGRGYWDAAARGELRVVHCPSCESLSWYPRSRCPRCLADGLELVPVSGDGTVYSFTVNRRPAGAYREAGPVVIAYVELAEGPRVLTNLIGVEPDQVRIDLPVRAVFDPTAAGAGLLRFTPREVSAG
ncbi:Zn-ribbon domain-containing OB-fold protein [Solwaraspora sp. WMMD1047]|uniref:Zn-ribbon domain-containing OB-fold protein n=1 Tax=Solwaraspora sp. WMMD1047 TaxID=3016102 RepID=UPI002415C70C|nr:Zn-ribbon domain-containing OB-fold protein [Solwaraspora sp. WMMD1047]MDG4830389.1 Zn-ribbon domain-containing OB-fold protein [Solwaraspora sp. WMMD1047]